MSQVRKGERYYWTVRGDGWIIGPADAEPGQTIRWRGLDFIVVVVDGKHRVKLT